MELSTILVVIEPDSEAQPALERAAQLATLSGARLELLLAEYNSYLADGHYFDPVQARELRQLHGEQRMQELEELAKPLREQGIEVNVSTAWGNPAYGEVIHRVQETGPSLLVKSTRHHNKLARLLLAHSDWELIRQCPIPMLLVKGGPWAEQPMIVAAVDPNHVNDKPAALDDTIITTARQWGSLIGGAVKLFHSAWLPPLSGLYPLQPDMQREERQLVELAEKHGLSQSDCEWSDEPIGEALPALIEEHSVGVVVMGAISRSRMEQALIGNTASKLLDDLTCDVLIVRPN